ncbi:MAG: CocE/NonD family hydrolase [Chloroflexota bacterium]
MKRDIFSPAEHQIQSSNTYRIPVSSGVTLGATITRPVEVGRFPALVWYDPYRVGMHGQPDDMAVYFAERGYAFVNLHVRGTGNSEGFSVDEYTAAETQDGVDAITWLAEQPWCSGKAGMLGTSYSGFSTLQVAAMAPPALKAIAPAYFTDRRYTDDCHYKGGCLRGYYDMLTYGLSMVVRTSLPPIPSAVGDGWSEIWQERLEKGEPYLLKWLAHQTEDEYWDTGSIVGHYDKIKAAALLIGGWHDGYLNPPLRVFQELESPKRLLMGPWSHMYGHISHCGPRIDIYFELLRWWDYWLKELDNGVMDEPAVQVYEQAFEEPIVNRTHIAGQWRGADDLPSAPVETLYLTDSVTSTQPSTAEGQATVRYLPAACRNGGLWDAGVPFTLPGDQRTDSAHAINFTGRPLDADLSILGMPTFRLYVSADVEVMPVAVRLLEIGADGTSVLVTKGILNLTRRNSLEQPEPLIPGKVTLAEFHMEATCWRFQKGNRISVSINGSDFPNVWPTPQAGHLTVHWGPDTPSQIELPIWEAGQPLAFEYLPSTYPILPFGDKDAPWRVVHDMLEDRYRLQIERGEGEMAVSHRNPAEGWLKSTQVYEESWPGATVKATVMGNLTSDETNFYVNITLNVLFNDAPYFQKRWSETFARILL